MTAALGIALDLPLKILIAEGPRRYRTNHLLFICRIVIV
jgi:hypothetical protein